MFGRKKSQNPDDVYKIVQKACEASNFKYQKDDENKTLIMTVQGDDLPITMVASVYPEEELLNVTCGLMFEIPPNKHESVISALNDINSSTLMGSFSLSREKNMIFYQLYQTYSGTKLSVDTVNKILLIAIGITDRHDGELKKLLPDDWDTGMYR